MKNNSGMKQRQNKWHQIIKFEIRHEGLNITTQNTNNLIMELQCLIVYRVKLKFLKQFPFFISGSWMSSTGLQWNLLWWLSRAVLSFALRLLELCSISICSRNRCKTLKALAFWLGLLYVLYYKWMWWRWSIDQMASLWPSVWRVSQRWHSWFLLLI